MMNHKQSSLLRKMVLGGFVSFCLILSSNNAFGAERTKERSNSGEPELSAERKFPIDIEHEKTRLPDPREGFNLESLGGLSYAHKGNPCYWFKLSGVIRLDEYLFMGSARDKRGAFPSGANIRTADVYLDGGVGKDWSYTFGVSFGQISGTPLNGTYVLFQDTWLSYIGFFQKNNEIFVGRVPGNWFGLDDANSGSWNPFLERSMLASAFYPGDGLGVMTDFWWEYGALTLVASTTDHANRIFANDFFRDIETPNSLLIGDDRWKGIARLTFAPVHDQCEVWHFGVSAAYVQADSRVHGLLFGELRPRAYPDARARITIRLVDTGVILGATHAWIYDVEAAHLCGPLLIEGEIAGASVYRTDGLPGTLDFYGYNIQARYLLTGGVHEYDVRDGNFGKPTVFIPGLGALEVAARYDFLNLNDKDIQGGSEHNVTLGFNWFINPAVRFSVNYIRADIHPGRIALFRNHRTLDIVGARFQVRFK